MHTLEKRSKHNLKLKKHHMISVLRIYPEIYKVRKLHVHKVVSMDPEMMSVSRILQLHFSFLSGQNHIGLLNEIYICLPMYKALKDTKKPHLQEDISTFDAHSEKR